MNDNSTELPGGGGRGHDDHSSAPDALGRMLREYRTEPSDDTAKRQARLRLLTAASTGNPPTQSSRPRRSVHSTLAWRLTLPAAAACAAIAVIATGSSSNDDTYRLVRVTAPVFPVTPGYLPGGVSAPTYSLDEQGIVAVWTADHSPSVSSSAATSSIFIRISPERAPAGTDDEASRVNVSPGVEAQLWTRPADRFAALVYRRGNQWIKIGGQSSLADPTTLLRIARSLTQEAPPVSVSVSLAPDGWELLSFKDDVALYDDPNSNDPTRALSVSLDDRYDPRRATDGIVDGIDVTVGRVHGHGALRDHVRYLTFPLDDGRGVTLQGPADMPLRDLVRIAASTSVTEKR